jgi:hypothetical protein
MVSREIKKSQADDGDSLSLDFDGLDLDLEYDLDAGLDRTGTRLRAYREAIHLLTEKRAPPALDRRGAFVVADGTHVTTIQVPKYADTDALVARAQARCRRARVDLALAQRTLCVLPEEPESQAAFRAALARFKACLHDLHRLQLYRGDIDARRRNEFEQDKRSKLDALQDAHAALAGKAGTRGWAGRVAELAGRHLALSDATYAGCSSVVVLQQPRVVRETVRQHAVRQKNVSTVARVKKKLS